MFAFVGMALAYFAYRHNLPLALRSALYPLIGKRINGPIGYAVDGFGIIATVFGLGADMGFGVLHLNAGLDYLFGISHSQWVQVILITLMMGAAVAVAVAGVEKGVRVMSDINLFLACALLLFVLFAGPTQHLFNTLIQNLGDYLGALPRKSFDVYAYGENRGWLGGWTVFYWAWWIAWAPFVGLFIARISRGRTIREFVFGVLLIPLGFTLAWMSIFGNSALDQVINHGMTALGQSALDNPSMSLYLLLETYPGARQSSPPRCSSASCSSSPRPTRAPWCCRPCRPRAVTLMRMGRTGCVSFGGDDCADHQCAVVRWQHRFAEVGSGADVAAVLAHSAVHDVGAAQGVLPGVAAADRADALAGPVRPVTSRPWRLAPAPEPGGALPVT